VKVSDWNKSEIEKLAKSSGRPDEVLCAEAFLKAKWVARLSSHYQDGPKTRELDVLAEKQFGLKLPGGHVTACVRALVSCRGFPEERAALVYSVSRSSVPSYEPALLTAHHLVHADDQRSNGPMPAIAEEGAIALLSKSNLLNKANPIVAFDIIEREENIVKDRTTKLETVKDTYERKGDRGPKGEGLYDAIDSCVQAAQAWVNRDFIVNTDISFATLNVPVCVLSKQFFSVNIDGGKVGTPDVQTRGYHTASFPRIAGAPLEIMTLLWTKDELVYLVDALDELFLWFKRELENRARIAGTRFRLWD
jgi:hypothetical protein